MKDANKVETRHCSGCGEDKLWSQFKVEKQNSGGTTWTKTRKWCHACCDALFKKQEKSLRVFAAGSNQWAEDEKRKGLLGPLPAWCDRDAVDCLVNAGKPSVLAYRIGVFEIRETHGYVARARHMDLLWRAFGKHEREIGDSIGGRGSRFICAMAEILQEPEPKLRQKLKRMCKHVDGLSEVLETSATTRVESQHHRKKLQVVQ